MIKKVILVLSLSIIISTPLTFPLSLNCYATPDKEVSELQERCVRSAEEFFKNMWGNGIIETTNGMMLINYMYHYNIKMNKCFVLLEKTNYEKNEVISNIKELWDINENENYGNFFKYVKDDKPFACKVANKRCNSQYAWDSLVRPYMEE
jgi:hypothetical protein